jgi:hypothetical protein
MEIGEWIERLKNECPSLQGRVFGAAERAVATTNSMQTPCAFVIPMAESAKENSTFPGHRQKITSKIGISIAVTNKSDARGGAAHIALKNVRDEVRFALCGWQPKDAEIPVDFVVGEQNGFDNFTMRWSDVFTTSYYFIKMPT